MTNPHPTPQTPPVSGTSLLQAASQRATALPWNAQSPGTAVSRVFAFSEGWVRAAANPTTIQHTLAGNVPPGERVHSLSFYAYARPGQAVGLILDPFHPYRPHGQASRFLYWNVLHPNQRRVLLERAFETALVASSPVALLHRLRDRTVHDPDPNVRDIWGSRTATFVRDLLAGDVLEEPDRASLRTMAALGAFR